MFSWRIPRLQPDSNGTSSTNNDNGNTKSIPTPDVLHGYVYFSQQKDTTIRRGYAQRSIVIVTRNTDLIGLYTKMINILGPMYFDAAPGHAASVVETAVHNIYKW